MIRLRDISLRKRIMFTNFLMVCIPVVWLTIIGMVIFAGLQFTGTVRQSELALLWPEKGASMSISYAVSSLRAKAESNETLELEDVFEECLILEKNGVQSVVFSNGRLIYISDGADEDEIRGKVQQQCGYARSAMSWNEENFALIYSAPYDENIIFAAGQVPFTAAGYDDDIMEHILEAVLFIVLLLSIIVIIWLGLYLTRLLSRQIIEPLAELRYALAEIKKGNLEYSLAVSAQDEIGQTCRDFDLMRQELHNAKEERQKYEQNRKELIAGISHDLATPITLVKGYASGIRDGIAKTPEKQSQYIERIYNTSCTMEHLVESLFLFSKLDLGRIPFDMEAVSIYRYFEDVVNEMTPLFAEQGLILTLNAEQTDTAVMIDRAQFRRVIENLLTNCVKYKTSSTADVEFSIQGEEDAVVVSCIDHGAGVPKESLEKLFDSFYRTDSARTDVTKGSGLGLAIAKQIICAFHGEIWAVPTSGGGLTISMRLPIIKKEKHTGYEVK